MPISGAGLQPAGSSPAGTGLYSTAAVPNNSILPDVITSLPQTGRFINFQTKDYGFTSDGRLQGGATVPQLVLLALGTMQGSSVIPNLGQTFFQVQEQGPNFVQQMTAKVNTAIADLIKRKLVALRSVTVQQPPSNPDAAAVLIQWTDLTTGKTFTNTIGP